MTTIDTTPTASANPLARYLAALVSLAITVLGAFVVIPSEEFGLVAGLQLVVLGASTATTLFVPLVDAKWQGLFKTGLALVGAGITAAIPFVMTGSIDAQGIGLVLLALFQAVGVEIGVNVRKDDFTLAA